jgi:hypothetical protein
MSFVSASVSSQKCLELSILASEAAAKYGVHFGPTAAGLFPAYSNHICLATGFCRAFLVLLNGAKAEYAIILEGPDNKAIRLECIDGRLGTSTSNKGRDKLLREGEKIKEQKAAKRSQLDKLRPDAFEDADGARSFDTISVALFGQGAMAA